MKELAELVLIPIALRGHLPSMLEFARLVVGRDDRFSVTLLVVEFWPDPALAAYVDSLVTSFAPSQRIKLIRIALDCASADAATHPALHMSQTAERFKLPVRNHVEKMARDSGNRLVGFVVDVLLMSMADVADEFGVPTYNFWASGAGILSLKLHLAELGDRAAYENLNVPGFNEPVPAHAVPASLLGDATAAVFADAMMSRVRKAKGVVMNTCSEIESHVISSLNSSASRSPPVYPVGPMLNLTSTDGGATVKWLDDQPPSSVIYLCFGSLGKFSPDQIKEIAVALERTGFRFLWTLQVPPPKNRPTLTNEDSAHPSSFLPQGFLDRTAQVGRIIEWAPQVAVLAHPAVGGFVSHCGWNSLLESLWFGVPVVAWPRHSEQQLNAFEMVTELGLSVSVKPGCRTDYRFGGVEAALVRAEEIESAIRRVMEGESEVRKRVKERSEKCREAVKEGGSSLCWLDKFLNDVFQNLGLD